MNSQAATHADRADVDDTSPSASKDAPASPPAAAHDPLPPRIRAHYPFASHWHTHPDGVRQHAVVDGPRDAPAVVLVHGNPTWSFAFRALILALIPHRRVIALDHVGMGLSDKPGADYGYGLSRHIDNAAAVLDGLGVDDYSLIVHDWGGPIGLGVALNDPARVRRLVVMNTAAFRSPRLPFRIACCRWPLFGPLAVMGLNGFARAAVRTAVTKRLRSEVQAGYLWPYRRVADRIGILRFVTDIPRSPRDASYERLLAIETALPRLADCPMMLAWGMRDWCFTPEHFLDEWRRRFPDAEVHEYADAGHYLFEDAAHELTEDVIRFLVTDAG